MKWRLAAGQERGAGQQVITEGEECRLFGIYMTAIQADTDRECMTSDAACPLASGTRPREREN